MDRYQPYKKQLQNNLAEGEKRKTARVGCLARRRGKGEQETTRPYPAGGHSNLRKQKKKGTHRRKGFRTGGGKLQFHQQRTKTPGPPDKEKEERPGKCTPEDKRIKYTKGEGEERWSEVLGEKGKNLSPRKQVKSALISRPLEKNTRWEGLEGRNQRQRESRNR